MPDFFAKASLINYYHVNNMAFDGAACLRFLSAERKPDTRNHFAVYLIRYFYYEGIKVDNLLLLKLYVINNILY